MEPWKEVSWMVEVDINDVITDYFILSEGYLLREGFVFTIGQENPTVFNRIVIRKPERARADEARMGYSYRTLEEHIELINMCGIEKAYIICDDLEFILRCPTLNDIIVFPSLEANNKFDYSVLYRMPQIKKMYCKTNYGDVEHYKTSIDYSKIAGLEDVSMEKEGHVGYEYVQNLKTLWICNNKRIRNFSGLSCSSVLQEVTFLECGIKSLEGIGNHKMMKSLTLWHNYSLTDISALAEVSDTLTELVIDACSKVKDFTVLDKLENLEYLSLEGNNILPNLNFLEKMKKLKFFTFTMNVEDGNLNNCMKIPYVSCKNRKHYNLKDKELPKNLL